MQILVIFLLTFLLAEEKFGFNGANANEIYTNYEVGHRLDGDVLIKDDIVKKEPETNWLGMDKEASAQYEYSGKSLSYKKITAVKLYQQDEKGFKVGPAKFELLGGGIGKTSIEFKLTSKSGLGFKYRVLFFGEQ